jgi:hypothetical protein
MKVCSRCGLGKNILCFSKNAGKVDGLNVWCKECCKVYRDDYYILHKDYEIERKNLRKASNKKWFEDYRSKLCCEICEESHPATLDFHHKNVIEKDFNVSILVSEGYGIKRILEEIAKCRVLCSNCHRKLHWEERREYNDTYDSRASGGILETNGR